MPIFKGNESGLAQEIGAGGSAILAGNALGKARPVLKILVGDTSGIAQAAYIKAGYGEKDPYIITQYEDFERIRKEPYAWYKLGADIEIPKDFLLISRFYGVLDGGGHSLTCEGQKGSEALIDYNEGIVQNLYLHNLPYGRLDRYLVSNNAGVIRHCYFRVKTRWGRTPIKTNNNGGIIANCMSHLLTPDTVPQADISGAASADYAAITTQAYKGGLIQNCVAYLNQLTLKRGRMSASTVTFDPWGGAGDFYKCYWSTVQGVQKNKSVHYGWIPKSPTDKTTYDITEFDNTKSPLGQVELNFDNEWCIDGDGNLALKGMGKMDFSRNE